MNNENKIKTANRLSAFLVPLVVLAGILAGSTVIESLIKRTPRELLLREDKGVCFTTNEWSNPPKLKPGYKILIKESVDTYNRPTRTYCYFKIK